MLDPLAMPDFNPISDVTVKTEVLDDEPELPMISSVTTEAVNPISSIIEAHEHVPTITDEPVETETDPIGEEDSGLMISSISGNVQSLQDEVEQDPIGAMNPLEVISEKNDDENDLMPQSTESNPLIDDKPNEEADEHEPAVENTNDNSSNPLNVENQAEEDTTHEPVDHEDNTNPLSAEKDGNTELGLDDSTNPYSDNEGNPLSAENEENDEDMVPEPNMDTNDNPIGDDVGPLDMDSATEQSQSNMSGSFMEPSSTEPIDRNGKYFFVFTITN